MEEAFAMPVSPEDLREESFALELLRFEIHPAHRVPTYQFHLVHNETTEILGNIRLSIGSTPHMERYAGHIGYGIEPEHRGHRYASRAVRLLIPFAQRLEIDPLWITCDPENTASRRTLELAGAEFVEIVDVPVDCIIHQRGHPQKCRYRIDTTTMSLPERRS